MERRPPLHYMIGLVLLLVWPVAAVPALPLLALASGKTFSGGLNFLLGANIVGGRVAEVTRQTPKGQPGTLGTPGSAGQSSTLATVRLQWSQFTTDCHLGVVSPDQANALYCANVGGNGVRINNVDLGDIVAALLRRFDVTCGQRHLRQIDCLTENGRRSLGRTNWIGWDRFEVPLDGECSSVETQSFCGRVVTVQRPKSVPGLVFSINNPETAVYVEDESHNASAS
ncbi:hypothetical protein XA68_18068 [Ophiocordyceps unilateralis]|uniref:Ecp2 effector protein domain-containing protein n=1 Tax=Ophiocordyceps unilateralis TaxID=268505 RepID=A0A2A9P3W8_OPHUN|nr:hypothetical protein XA68_18068 [Ophiocordyceps unilateralis]